MTYVKKRTLGEVKLEAEEYARFQHQLARLSKLNEKIRYLFEQIRDLNCREVDEYRKVLTERKKNISRQENEKGN